MEQQILQATGSWSCLGRPSFQLRALSSAPLRGPCRRRDDSGASCRPLPGPGLWGKHSHAGWLRGVCLSVCLSAHLCRLSASMGLGSSLRTGETGAEGQPRSPGPARQEAAQGGQETSGPRQDQLWPEVRRVGPRKREAAVRGLLRNGGYRGECGGSAGRWEPAQCPPPRTPDCSRSLGGVAQERTWQTGGHSQFGGRLRSGARLLHTHRADGYLHPIPPPPNHGPNLVPNSPTSSGGWGGLLKPKFCCFQPEACDRGSGEAAGSGLARGPGSRPQAVASQWDPCPRHKPGSCSSELPWDTGTPEGK